MSNFSEDGAERKIDDLTNFTLVHPTGTNFRSTELAPGAKIAMVGVILFFRAVSLSRLLRQHRTSSLDYNILGACHLYSP